MDRRVEGLVNKHMADMALETLQHRLSAVSQEMNHLSAEISRREDSKRVEDLPRRSNTHFVADSVTESYSEEPDEKKLMPNTAASSSSSSSSAGRRVEQSSELHSTWVTDTFTPEPLQVFTSLHLTEMSCFPKVHAFTNLKAC